MRILLTNQHLNTKSGSELYTRNLAKELISKENEVYIYTPVVGILAEAMKKMGAKITDNLRDFEDIKFDIIHAQHNTTAIIARSLFPNTPMIFMSHGVLPDLERPPSIDLNIAHYLVVSEEIRKSHIENYKIPADKIDVIMNPVDIDRFQQTSPINKYPESLLVISNHYTKEVRAVVESACKELEIKLERVGWPENSVENVEDYINKSDIVISLGRGVLEAIACGRSAIVYDMHGADGMVTPENYHEIAKNNFSGRRYSKKYQKDDLISEIQKYSVENAQELSGFVRKKHAEKLILEKVINTYEKAIKNHKDRDSQISKGELFKEINFLQEQYNESVRKDNVISDHINMINELRSELGSVKGELNDIKLTRIWKITQKYLEFRAKIARLTGRGR